MRWCSMFFLRAQGKEIEVRMLGRRALRAKESRYFGTMAPWDYVLIVTWRPGVTVFEHIGCHGLMVFWQNGNGLFALTHAFLRTHLFDCEPIAIYQHELLGQGQEHRYDLGLWASLL